MRYVIAIGATALAVIVRLALTPILGPDAVPYITLFVLLVFLGWLTGLAPALVAMVLGALAVDYLVLEPRGSFGIADPRMIAGLIVYVVVGAASAFLGTYLRRLQVVAEEVARDASEREQRLRESENRFRTLADSSPVMIWVNNARGNVEFGNRAYLEFLGMSEEALRAGGWQQALHPDDVQGYAQAYQEAARERQPFFAECRLRHADGSWRWVASYAAPRFSDQGEYLGHVGSSPEITERKAAEEALRDADRRKNEFLAIMAHELRNPLAPIRTGLELLRRRGDDPAERDRLRTVMERQIDHLVRLVDDLLDVARVTSGTINLQRRPVALARLVTEAVDTMNPAIEMAGVGLTVRVPGEIILDVDPTRFVQVLSNLLHNAAKFTDRGGRVAVSAELQHENEHATMALTVRDSGEGIPGALLPRVFDLFVRGAPRDPGKAGLGIGLALSRQLIELHGGRLEGRSDGEGRGSEFTIYLPVTSPASDQPGEASGRR
jgi:PAS domain S-box-containing protein